MEVHKKFSEIRAKLKGSKHVKLQDGNGKDIVPFNQPKKPIGPKITQISQKLDSLPAGIYCVVAQDRFGANVHQDKYYYGKGKYDSSLAETSAGSTRNENQNSSENLLTLESAVENIRQSATLQAENTMLKSENARLTARVAELETKCTTLQDANEQLAADAEGEEEETPSILKGLTSFLEPLAPMIPGLADRYFDLQKQKDETRRAEMLLKHGYEIPGVKRNGSAPVKKKKAEMPVPGTPEWDQYVEEVMELDDVKFEQHLALIQTKFPDLYPHLEAAVYTEEN